MCIIIIFKHEFIFQDANQMSGCPAHQMRPMSQDVLQSCLIDVRSPTQATANLSTKLPGTYKLLRPNGSTILQTECHLTKKGLHIYLEPTTI